MWSKKVHNVSIATMRFFATKSNEIAHFTDMFTMKTILGLFIFGILVLPAIAADIKPNQTFTYAINGTKNDAASVKVIFVDLFDASTSRIKKLKSAGKTVICYFSAGSAENWRPDYKKYPKAALGKKLSGWDGEYWVDYRNATVTQILKDRIALAKQKGCDGVDPDNVDGHLNATGFSLTEKNQLTWIETLSQAAHAQGLKIGLKNSAETAWKLQPSTDFVVVEECRKYKECDRYKSFPQNSKPMFQIEYTKKSSTACADAKKMGATLIFANSALTSISYCP